MPKTVLDSEATVRRKTSPKFTGIIAGAFFALLVASQALPTPAQTSGAYKVTNLISDGSVAAAVTDASFVNPWAISASSTWWINTQGTGLSYVVASTPTAGTVNFKVNVPPASGVATAGYASGVATTGGSAGMILPSNATKANFLFSTLDGTISGWNSKLGTANAVAQVVINNSAAGASYPGLAIINNATTSFILAANFGTGKAIEVYDSAFQPTKLAGTFTDPTLPAGYAPFSVHVLNNKVYVAYALRTTTAPFRTVDAVGNGVVDVFDTTGNFVSRIATGGNLDSPWGVAFAPASFGIFGGSLLIGNFGNGTINAYDPTTFAYRGQLTDGTGKALVYASLWELLPGGTTVGNTTAVSGGDTNTVYFSAGLTGEVHGLFGAISNDTTTSSSPTFGFSAGTSAVAVQGGTNVSIPISVAPVAGFNGTVTLTCSGLPKGTTCQFSPSQIVATASAPGIAQLTIATSRTTAQLENMKHDAAGLVFACLFPFGSLLVFYRRRKGALGNGLGMLVVFGIMLAGVGGFVGCATVSTTPAGTSQVTVTAKSGTVTQTAVIALTVQ